MAIIELRDLTRRGGGAAAPLNLRVGDGEMMALLGPAGTGKSGILRLIAGLDPLSNGTVQVGPEAVEHLPPQDRDIAMVFAEAALYPYKTVRANIEFPLRARRVARDSRQEQVAYIADLLGLNDVLGAWPAALDAATQQLVALARALVRSPRLLLLDEPFARLKRSPRETLRARLRAVQRQMRVTTLLASDDPEEAMFLGDRIAVLRASEIIQVDTPINIYTHPAHAFVAGLAGSPPMNLFPATYRAGTVLVDDQQLPAPEAWQAALSDGVALLIGVRPEGFDLGGPPRHRLSVVLDPTSRVVLGSRILLQGQAGQYPATVELPVSTLDLPRHAFARLEQSHLFARDSGERLID